MGRRDFVTAALGSVSAVAISRSAGAAARRAPNIVFILVDDMGWGDVAAYNPHSAIPTPHLDRLASKGMRFTDMHASSAICTPSRYSVLTGRYPWRSRLKKGVLDGYDPSLIEPGRLTVAGLLKRAGYTTAGVGKWHLGLGADKPTDFTKPFHPAPTDLGFDTFFGLPASLDMPPYVYFENDRAVAPPTEQMKGREDGLGYHWTAGPKMPGFDATQAVPTFTSRAIEVIRREGKRSKPFFLYVSLPSPHNPWLPLPEYKGKSRAGDYGDYVVQTDAMVGKILAAIDDSGIANDTMVVFTSDNGAPWDDENIQRWGHRANAEWRGRKSDVWEGGHRIPCIVRWPGRVAPGVVSDEILSLTDFMATAAAIARVPLPAGTADDSFDFLPALERRNRTPIRPTIIEESGKGLMCIREGRWKLELGLGSGGFTNPDRVAPAPGGPNGQLYDLVADPGELNNVWSAHPDIVARLSGLLDRAVAAGRTRPG